jgi:acyl-CoA hydrolase
MVLNEALQGNLRFGLLLDKLDKLDKMAEDKALKYVNCYLLGARVVTAAIDDIFVRHAADVNRDIAFHARINHVGRSSLVVGIRVEQPGEPVNRCPDICEICKIYNTFMASPCSYSIFKQNA